MFQRKKGSTRPRQATIKDVAIAAGVSITTVSNFLNGRTGSMTEETWQRVEEAMNALDYSPSSIARGLVTRQTATLGLIISEIETPLFLQAVTSIEPIGRAAGYNLLLCNARNTEDERQVLSLLLEKRVEGIMFLSTSEHLEHGHLVELQSSGMPLALVNRALKHDGIYQIHWDNIRGVANAVRHLSELGHRRIAHLRGPSDRRSSQERLQGYRLGLEQMGLHYREDYVGDGDFTASHKLWTREALRLLSLSPRPTAVIGSDDGGFPRFGGQAVDERLHLHDEDAGSGTNEGDESTAGASGQGGPRSRCPSARPSFPPQDVGPAGGFRESTEEPLYYCTRWGTHANRALFVVPHP